ncbi:response regulator transcription factor [Mucilaginibacter polytrichastri]|uniref:Response regulator mprA n=1 Tax=Mucilaginibacter polytrichastri TaxID=1302689 RepID=A0A1Q5ZVJ0_9SPHI|nr:response regulator transcription factor [Mucilaginibacter polytrichastri]OKS85770.1 Response regulator mprA [Mucilaginibacter polytrichastri]SFS61608.1 DNA-binding response regulator, OmpR family, contains REC and winged-helix (wHTH) domain [Mucilaginibacter polytrichastri]
MEILLIEDEPKVSSFIAKGLQEYNYQVTVAGDNAAAKTLFNAQRFDLIIMDVMLPDGSGIELCRYVRKTNPDIPILMLTALDNIDSKVTGLQAGADDYLVKPFHFNELLARIEALLRRIVKKANEQVLTFADLKLNTWDNTAERSNIQIILTAKEYALLKLFMQNPNKTLSRDFIAEQVWGIDFDTHTNFIDVYVNYLRNKIEKGFNSKLIHTIIGMGYILKEK